MYWPSREPRSTGLFGPAGLPPHCVTIHKSTLWGVPSAEIRVIRSPTTFGVCVQATAILKYSFIRVYGLMGGHTGISVWVGARTLYKLPGRQRPKRAACL